VSRPIITPIGSFPSATRAAVAFGITRQAASQRALRRSGGWRYADDKGPPAVRKPGRPGKPVSTPKGMFASLTLAATAFGLLLSQASYKANQRLDGWRYVSPRRWRGPR
jgi:hypothetical protein